MVSSITNQDVQATLTAFTAITIVNAIKQHCFDNTNIAKVYLCGGGVHNKSLKNQINQQLKLKNDTYKLKIQELIKSQKDLVDELKLKRKEIADSNLNLENKKEVAFFFIFILIIRLF